ncbi:MAG: TRAP transporter large permease [Verrucomicrobia bacterium]|nr:TRAP transporter large permease [Verrucomicrobiota bacterium]MDA1069632.1 TRAP transporter large permease [Verrucomicrobiota bacterium]
MGTLITFALIFLILVAIAVPVAFALGASTMVMFLLSDHSLQLFTQRLWTGLDKFTLVAIPFFILAGELMSGSGILNRLMEFARLIVGRVKGGLYYINILVSMLFGGINGSAVADTSAIGSLLIKATSKEYDDPDLAAAVTACSSIVGPLIPPSLPMLIYAFAAANVSVAGLFLAGIVPGVAVGIALMVVTWSICRNRALPVDSRRYTAREVGRILLRFITAAVLPVIMVAGIVGGIVTPTEAGCVGIVYALLVGFFVTRELTIKAVYAAMARTVVVTSIVLLLVSVGNATTWWLTIEGLPTLLSEGFVAMTSSPAMFLLLMVLLYLFIGMFIEQAAAMIMLVPVFAPLAARYDVDPIHFGLVTCLSLALGLVTPPVGLCLFVASGIAGSPIQRVFRVSIPFIVATFIVLLVVTFLPSSFLWLPQLFGF